jgi:hypothetical protein
MADFDGSLFTTPNLLAGTLDGSGELHTPPSYLEEGVLDGSGDLLNSGGGVVLVTYFKMRGKDIDCLPTITYRTWVVSDTPDPTETFYGGPRCGVTPFADIVIADQWQV